MKRRLAAEKPTKDPCGVIGIIRTLYRAVPAS